MVPHALHQQPPIAHGARLLGCDDLRGSTGADLAAEVSLNSLLGLLRSRFRLKRSQEILPISLSVLQLLQSTLLTMKLPDVASISLPLRSI